MFLQLRVKGLDCSFIHYKRDYYLMEERNRPKQLTYQEAGISYRPKAFLEILGHLDSKFDLVERYEGEETFDIASVGRGVYLRQLVRNERFFWHYLPKDGEHSGSPFLYRILYTNTDEKHLARGEHLGRGNSISLELMNYSMTRFPTNQADFVFWGWQSEKIARLKNKWKGMERRMPEELRVLVSEDDFRRKMKGTNLFKEYSGCQQLCVFVPGGVKVIEKDGRGLFNFNPGLVSV
jgi:hypothetical protein